jgi:hypothetical protein
MAESTSVARDVSSTVGEQQLVPASPGWKWVTVKLESNALVGEQRLRVGDDGNAILVESGDVLQFVLAPDAAVRVTNSDSSGVEWSVVVTHLTFIDALARALSRC